MGQWVLVREVALRAPKGHEVLQPEVAALLEDGSFAVVAGRANELLVFDLLTGELVRRRSRAELARRPPWELCALLGDHPDDVYVAARVRRGPDKPEAPSRCFDLRASHARDLDAPEFVDLPGAHLARRAGGWWGSKGTEVVALDAEFHEVGAVRVADDVARFRAIGALDAGADGWLAVLERRSFPDGLCALASRPDDIAPDVVHLVDAEGVVRASFAPEGVEGYVERIQLGRDSLLVLNQKLAREVWAYEVTRDGREAAPLRLLRVVEQELRPLELPRLGPRDVWLDASGDALIVLSREPCRVLTFRRPTASEHVPR